MRWVLLVGLLLAPVARASDDRPDRRADPKLQKEINQAIADGVKWLKRSQGGDGAWDYPRGIDGTGGLTALALYALAASRVPPGDKTIVRGLRWTEKHKRPFDTRSKYGTYSASLLVLALTRIDPTVHQKRIARLAERLWRSQLGNDMWTYRLWGTKGNNARSRRGGMAGDNSNSQFAVLALWAAHTMARVDVPRKTWRRIHDFYMKTQHIDGSWNYTPVRGHGAGKPSMTAAGLVSFVYAAAALKDGARSLPDARKTKTAQAGKKALFLKPFNFQTYYFVYSLERVGTVMAVPEKEWYFEGARALIKSQHKNGSWQANRWHGDSEHVYETSLALLFLSRATRYFIGPTTRSESFPDPAKAGNLDRAFEYYHGYKPEMRARVLHSFGGAGPAAVAFLVGKLRDKQKTKRATAYELLTKLVDKQFFFEPGWHIEERNKMLAPIEAFVLANRARLRWDEKRKLFVVAR